ncbi:MAG: formate--tetrahydrofolate ligase [Acidobacteriota bacterium]|nr:formate--tetrahydrofolate ligase [Acidobacteriota bacterium]
MKKNLLPIEAIAAKLNLTENLYERRTLVSAKLSLDLLKHSPRGNRRGKLILVTATSPTTSGEGKTVTSIGLVQGLEKIGKSAIITSREPSLGPVFGMKGGAAGGGKSRIEPAEKINLHFHGDFHAITSAHSLLSALMDSHLFHGNELDLDPDAVTWPRAVDMNDRALRNIIVSVTSPEKRQRDGGNRASGFLITAASEIMAILSLASGRDDLRRRIARIVVGPNRKGEPVTAADLRATGPMLALLSEALLPNLAQTTEGTPAMVHCGPFGNIAHGTSSVVSHEIGMRLADYVVNETGFASDLGFEKYMDLVMPTSGIKPSIAVLVTTVQSLRNQGEGDLERGFAHLEKHMAIVRGFHLPLVVAINRFPNDTPAELEKLRQFCEGHGASFALSEAFTRGGDGSVELAKTIVDVIAASPSVEPTTTYSPADSAVEKITKVARSIYGADGIELSARAQENLARFDRWGFGHLPVCIAKTQYSLSDDPKRMGAPTGWTLHVTDVALSAGAGFLVVIAGSMMLMPGLPKVSRALDIDVDDDGEIIGMS